MAKILVTDDEADMRLALINTLELAGYSVEDAGSGKAALERLGRGGIDLVLLDIRLPDMDGVQILGRIKKEHPGVPVIMLTGFGSLETAVKTVQLGAADYVSKPFENRDLFSRIEKALGARELAAPAGPITARLLRDLGVEGKAVDERDAQSIRPVAPPRRKRWALAALAALALAGGAAGWLRWQAGGLAEIGSPTAHLSGLAFDGEHFWLSDWFGQTVYECRLAGDQLVVHRSYPLPDARPAGLAWSGEALYMTDAWARTLAKRALDPTLSVVFSTASAGPAPAGLFWDGGKLWSADTELDAVLRHAPDADLAVQKRLKSAGTAPVGVALHGEHLWVADADTRRVYRHRLDADYSLAETLTHPKLKDAARPLSAFTIVGDDAWFGFEGEQKLVRVRLSLLERVGG